MFARALRGAALAAGVLLGAVTLLARPGIVPAAVVVGVVVAVVVGRKVRDRAPDGAVARTRAGWCGGLLAGAVAAGGVLALTGLVLLLGPASVTTLLALAVATSAAWLWRRPDRGAALRTNPLPAVLDRVLRAVQAAPPRAAGPPGPMPWSVPIPAHLSIPQLCLAWQRTYFALLDLPADAPRAAIVRLRTGLLDEIERRDPEGFGRWLETGARAGGDPSSYLAGDR